MSKIIDIYHFNRYLVETKPSGKDLEQRERTRAEQSLFIQEVLLATLTDSKLSLQDDSEPSEGLTQGASAGNISPAVPPVELGNQKPIQASMDDYGTSETNDSSTEHQY